MLVATQIVPLNLTILTRDCLQFIKLQNVLFSKEIDNKIALRIIPQHFKEQILTYTILWLRFYLILAVLLCYQLFKLVIHLKNVKWGTLINPNFKGFTVTLTKQNKGTRIEDKL